MMEIRAGQAPHSGRNDKHQGDSIENRDNKPFRQRTRYSEQRERLANRVAERKEKARLEGEQKYGSNEDVVQETVVNYPTLAPDLPAGFKFASDLEAEWQQRGTTVDKPWLKSSLTNEKEERLDILSKLHASKLPAHDEAPEVRTSNDEKQKQESWAEVMEEENKEIVNRENLKTEKPSSNNGRKDRQEKRLNIEKESTIDRTNRYESGKGHDSRAYKATERGNNKIEQGDKFEKRYEKGGRTVTNRGDTIEKGGKRTDRFERNKQERGAKPRDERRYGQSRDKSYKDKELRLTKSQDRKPQQKKSIENVLRDEKKDKISRPEEKKKPEVVKKKETEEERLKREEEEKKIAEEKEKDRIEREEKERIEAERLKKEAEEREIEEEKKTLEAYVKDTEERISMKNDLRQKNIKASENRPDESFFFKLDSNLKKNTAFVKKIKNFTESQGESVMKEFDNLNLTKYIGEIASALTEVKL